MKTNSYQEHTTGSAPETVLSALGLPFHVILPSQFYPTDAPRTPEERLLVAILRDAVDCYQKHASAAPKSKCGRLYEDARSWIFDEPAHKHAISFEGVCEALNIDVSYLRGVVAGLGARKLPRRSGVVANAG